MTIITFLITIAVLVTIHEFGHFWVARRLGIKVLKFSIGFGPALYEWSDKQDTKYVIAAIPLGGFVSMLGEQQEELTEAEKPQAFCFRPLWHRVAVVSAGPIINLLFAILLYWVIFMIGIEQSKPIIGSISPQTVAAQSGLTAGDEITAVNGKSVKHWQGFVMEVINGFGTDKPLNIEVVKQKSQLKKVHEVSIQGLSLSNENTDLFALLGIERYYPTQKPIIDHLVKGQAAEQQGLQKGDEIITANGQNIESWRQWTQIIRENPNKEIALTLKREGQVKQLKITPNAKTDKRIKKEIGFLGVAPKQIKWPEEYRYSQRFGPIDAIPQAWQQFSDMVGLNLSILGKIVMGKMSLELLSGPIGIAKGAKSSFDNGVVSFLFFLALLSISLGILNFLPIPILDGGHLLYYVIEAVRGRPLSTEMQAAGYKVGLSLIVLLTIWVCYQDILRW